MTDTTNDYPPGSLPWIERNHALNLRAILDSLIAGDCTTEEAAEMLHSLDTDTVR